MTLLSIVQDVCDANGIPRPTVVIDSTDRQVRRLLALANRDGKALVKRGQWQELQTEATLTTLAAELQGTLASIAPGFRSIINQTAWNRTNQDFVAGPLSPQDWQALQAQVSTGPYHEFRIQGDSLYLYPAPTAGQTVAFEYMSKNWCESSGGTGQTEWAADGDVGVLDEDLLTLGLSWRWRAANGLEYVEEFTEYERWVNDAVGNSGGRRALNMGSVPTNIPVARAPDGSWSP